uniref:Ig-like domain-containing protein n=1 Tax=Stegastes partitus TaxID=144197 RepID=A0A3B4ZRF7_9TELE
MFLFFSLQLLAFFLCWISVSVSEFLIVEVQPAHEVTLMCNNYTSVAANIFWFRMTSEPNISCISSMSSSDSNASLCDGFKNGNFIMTSNITNLFLKIKIDLSDSGLYYCGFYANSHPTNFSDSCTLFPFISDNSESDGDDDCKSQKKSDENTNLMVVILGGLTVLLLMVIIGLLVKIKKLHREKSDENTNLMVVILGGLTVFFVMVIIGLLVKIKKLHRGTV